MNEHLTVLIDFGLVMWGLFSFKLNCEFVSCEDVWPIEDQRELLAELQEHNLKICRIALIIYFYILDVLYTELCL